MLHRLASILRPCLAPIPIVTAGILVISVGPASADEPNRDINQPDRAAWQLFVAITQYSARPGNNDALFETWASDTDTFDAAPAWPAAGGLSKRLAASRLDRDIGSHRTAAPTVAECAASWKPGAAPCIGEEIRRNRASFDYIIQNGLYSQAGLAAAFGKSLSFPLGAVEVQADWIPVDELQSWNGTPPDQADRLYHVNNAIGPGGKPVAYALVALHVASKTNPNWSWATFEHWKNPARCDEIGCHDRYGAATAHVPPNGKPNQGYPECPKSGAVLAEFTEAGLAPVWQNYCLEGTQTSYVTTMGAATLLGNSVIDGLNAGVPVGQSSCMTCHATAAFDAKGDALTVGLDADRTGAPRPDWFGVGAMAFQQADFSWAVPLCAVPTGGKSRCGG